jgi:hypothetical protein
MTQRYVVPEEGLKAAVEKCDRANWNMSRHGIKQALEAFIRWQAENAQVPTEEQAKALTKELDAPYPSLFFIWWPMAFNEWIRRMYLAPPEPEAGCVHCGNSYKFVPDPPCACGHVHATYTGCGAEGCRCKKWHSECYYKAPEPEAADMTIGEICDALPRVIRNATTLGRIQLCNILQKEGFFPEKPEPSVPEEIKGIDAIRYQRGREQG